jgi:hypothetical protein
MPRQGPYVEQADVAFSFSAPVRIYGIHQESPSALHHLDCGGLTTSSAAVQLPDPAKEIGSVQCSIRPILFQGNDTHPFRITLATDKSEAPQVVMAARNIDLVAADQFSPKDQGNWGWGFALSSFVTGAALISLLKTIADARASRRARERS